MFARFARSCRQSLGSQSFHPRAGSSKRAFAAGAGTVLAVGVPGLISIRPFKKEDIDKLQGLQWPAGHPNAKPTRTPEPAPVHASESEMTEAQPTSDSNGGAFNPETGEINWDCPCLGGMAHGPCGEEFRAAFSCFVFSEEEPKGINCVEKFQGMQTCFRQHPEVYAAEIAEDEAADEDPVTAAERVLAEDPDPVAAAERALAEDSEPTA